MEPNQSRESDKVTGDKEPRLHPNDTTHNVENLDQIMANLRQEASELQIQDAEELDRNELIDAIAKARKFNARGEQPLTM